MNNVFIITQIRSGTQMLMSALETHPDINVQAWPDESQDKWNSLNAFLRNPDKTNVVMCHQWGEHHIKTVLGIDINTFWANMATRFDKYIMLRRKNVLKSYISNEIARKSGYAVSAMRADNPIIDVDVDDLLGFVVSTWKVRRQIEGHIKKRLDISYEGLIGNWDETIKTIQEHIGVEPKELTPTTHKQETRPMGDIISNVDEVREFLSECHWGGWLNES